MTHTPSPSDRRQYIRLDSVFPVQFKVASFDGKNFLSEWIQGFTHNVSPGGLRLDVNNCKPQLVNLLKSGKVSLYLQISMPLSRPAVNASAKVAWVGESEEDPNRCCIGLTYQDISAVGERRIMRYIMAKRLSLPVVTSVIVLLGFGFAVNGYLNVKLVQGNKALVQQLIKILQEWSVAKEKIKDINRDKEELQRRIDTFRARIQGIEVEKQGLLDKARIDAGSVKELNDTIEKLNREKAVLQEQLIKLQHEETAVTEELLQLNQKKTELEKANLDKMYRWLVVHQNPHTGLVMSFEGDSEVANWAFTYDQSLAMQAYTMFSDVERAKGMLEFYRKRAKRVDSLFVNAYYADDGNPAEYTVHSGPNIWLGIAIVQYTKKTGDTRYLYLAEEIAAAITKLQEQDAEGGIRGGPQAAWYSTEHNLDGYAFFTMLGRLTGKEQYRQAAEKVLLWLVAHTYDRQDVPIKRGKGDATIATDTYAWSIAAIGPEKLASQGMNPDKIIEFAEQNCGAQVEFQRPDGTMIKVKGFDFAAQRNVARGGVVSTEWTAQMIMAFKIMAEYSRAKGLDKKAVQYEEKADEYMSQICNMIIASPSASGQGEGCLPYASTDFVDTGHGWMTPKGKTTGSVSGTAYTLFTYHNYNPLRLKE